MNNTSTNFTSPLCLIIDDDKHFRQILRMRVTNLSYNFNVVEKSDLASAREFLKTNSPNLVFLDQHLPDGLGHSLLEEEYLASSVVIALSSDESPELPIANLKKGARLFFQKAESSRSFFFPMIEALLARVELEHKKKMDGEINAQIETVKKLIKTLQHEINNPLGAVLGSLFLLKSEKSSEEDKNNAIQLLEESSSRIKNVLDSLASAPILKEVEKGPDLLFHIPGDKEWK